MRGKVFADITKLSGRIISKDFVGFDCETYSNKNIFRLASFVFSDFSRTFFSKRDMIDYLYTNKRLFQGKLIVATNLHFDLMALFFDMPEFKDLNIVWNKSKIICATIKFSDSDKHGNIVFVDTLNYSLNSVEELGNIINLPKLNIDKEVLFQKENLSKEEINILKEYNINDATISMKYMYNYQKILNDLGGNIKLTSPSCSLDLFRRKFLFIDLIKEEKILKDNSVTDFIFKSYYGGRCENFVKGDFDNVYYYDVNSLYPFMMLNYIPVPQSVKEVKDFSIDNIYNFMGVTDCIIKSPDNLNIPLLPVKLLGKTLFPSGVFQGVWCHNILELALNNGYEIIKINRQIVYTQKIKLFENYVNTLYTLRKKLKQEHNSDQDTIKLFLNSLYGKWGQKKRTIYEIMLKNEMNDKILNKKLKQNYEINESADSKFFILTKEGTKYPKNSFPIIASYITSYALSYMFNFYKKYNVLYTDTDSIMTSTEITDTNMIGVEIGQLKKEKFGTVNFQYPKCYMFNDNPTIKGIHFSKELPLNIKKELYLKYINGGDIEQKSFIKLKASLRRIENIRPNEIIIFQKHLNKGILEKRIFNKNGLSKPLKIGVDLCQE